ncbi:MAG: 16S rRNA (cytosine(1402)-N(4))-methyltransferase, partial [Actinobacteria bacterium]|nr:16S rRNA (cytosine(1402)-N(4))-methyltransferase [Actinomycetota bacterium]
MAQSFSHNPVMLDQVVAEFSLVPAGLVVDATAGGGGHSAAILLSRSELSILALDRDELAVTAARAKLELFEDRATVVHGSFGELAGFTEGREISGVLLDLGVSSPQIDTA